jgi:hypothetical protein
VRTQSGNFSIKEAEMFKIIAKFLTLLPIVFLMGCSDQAIYLPPKPIVLAEYRLEGNFDSENLLLSIYFEEVQSCQFNNDWTDAKAGVISYDDGVKVNIKTRHRDNMVIFQLKYEGGTVKGFIHPNDLVTFRAIGTNLIVKVLYCEGNSFWITKE